MADDEATTNVGPQEVVATHRTRREVLHEAAIGLDAALQSLEAATAPDRERLAGALQDVVAPLQEHVDGANQPGGILAQVIDAAPWLASRARQLGREHDALLDRATALAAQAASEGAEVDALLREARELATAMTRHVHRGTTLILDAYMLDIPDGD
jgi:hypothetical protein